MSDHGMKMERLLFVLSVCEEFTRDCGVSNVEPDRIIATVHTRWMKELRLRLGQCGFSVVKSQRRLNQRALVIERSH